jgi:membrane-associated phospholipid phosphatase
MTTLMSDRPRVHTGRALHHEPPVRPAHLWARPRLVAVLAFGFLAAAIAARIDDSALLLHWDRPIERFVGSIRTPALDSFFRSASRLGAAPLVYVVGAILAAVAALRCRALAVVILVATAGRPFLELAIKLLVDRDRPGSSQLVRGRGPSFPSGHVMASVALWGLVPAVIALYTHRRAVWWAVVGAMATLVFSIAACRVYLGVHWATDACAGLVVGAFGLAALDALLWRVHRSPRLAAWCCGCPSDHHAHRHPATT